MKNTQIVALVAWLSFIALLWLFVLELIEPGGATAFVGAVFFVIGVFSGIFSLPVKR